jgi:thioredoxin-like negative regulator of GroEL
MKVPYRIAVAAIVALMVTAPTRAADFRDFDSNAFAAAQASGEPVLVDVHAWWCPVCASQNHTIKTLTRSPHYDKLVVFRLDYDKQKDDWKRMGVTTQGTLIAYRGQTETGRLAYQTNATKIEVVLDSAVR